MKVDDSIVNDWKEDHDNEAIQAAWNLKKLHWPIPDGPADDLQLSQVVIYI